MTATWTQAGRLLAVLAFVTAAILTLIGYNDRNVNGLLLLAWAICLACAAGVLLAIAGLTDRG